MTPEQLKLRRKALGLSQAQVASKLGISQPIYSTLETGKKAFGEYTAKMQELGLLDRDAPMVPGCERPITPEPVQAVETKDEAEDKPEPKSSIDIAGDYKGVKVGEFVVRRGLVAGEVRAYEYSGKPRFIVKIGEKVGYLVWAVDECEKHTEVVQ